MDYIQLPRRVDVPALGSTASFESSTEPDTMRYSTQVKSISYLKANAADMLDKLAEQREPVLITQNGEARAVLQDVASYEETQDTIALLKMLALGDRDFEQGRVQPLAEAVDDLRAELRKEFGAGP
jgi:prevent-host-death family protein